MARRLKRKETSVDPTQRADELLREMTVEEKAMQLSCAMPLALLDRDGLMRGQADMLIQHGIGHVAGIGLLGHKAPETIAKSVNAVQRYLVTETRLKIPAIFHNEALNGVVAPHFSAFPTPIGLAADSSTCDSDALPFFTALTSATCRRPCRIRVGGRTATRPRRSPITAASWPRSSVTGSSTSSRSTSSAR